MSVIATSLQRLSVARTFSILVRHLPAKPHIESLLTLFYLHTLSNL